MRFVAMNTEAQQDLQMLHRIRHRLVGERTALINQIRGLLGEYGIVFAQGPGAGTPRVGQDIGGQRAGVVRVRLELLSDLHQQLRELDESQGQGAALFGAPRM